MWDRGSLFMSNWSWCHARKKPRWRNISSIFSPLQPIRFEHTAWNHCNYTPWVLFRSPALSGYSNTRAREPVAQWTFLNEAVIPSGYLNSVAGLKLRVAPFLAAIWITINRSQSQHGKSTNLPIRAKCSMREIKLKAISQSQLLSWSNQSHINCVKIRSVIKVVHGGEFLHETKCNTKSFLIGLRYRSRRIVPPVYAEILLCQYTLKKKSTTTNLTTANK